MLAARPAAPRTRRGSARAHQPAWPPARENCHARQATADRVLAPRRPRRRGVDAAVKIRTGDKTAPRSGRAAAEQSGSNQARHQQGAPVRRCCCCWCARIAALALFAGCSPTLFRDVTWSSRRRACRIMAWAAAEGDKPAALPTSSLGRWRQEWTRGSLTRTPAAAGRQGNRVCRMACRQQQRQRRRQQHRQRRCLSVSWESCHPLSTGRDLLGLASYLAWLSGGHCGLHQVGRARHFQDCCIGA
jgi:hypothetical protein